jgi:hypothetical protein
MKRGDYLKKFNLFYILPILIAGILGGCHKDIPEPETKSKLVPAGNIQINHSGAVPVFYQDSKEIPALMVQFNTVGKNVFVECILRGISFRESEHTRQKVGKLVVWIDGKRNQEVKTAAFIIKSLPPGNHKVKLEVVDLNNVPYGLTKEFLVNIPK